MLWVWKLVLPNLFSCLMRYLMKLRIIFILLFNEISNEVKDESMVLLHFKMKDLNVGFEYLSHKFKLIATEEKIGSG